jgi:orotate phosphoribosyltransferase
VHATELAASVDRAARLSGRFTLRSGAIATEYFDKYLFESDPSLLGEVAKHLVPLVPAVTDVLAGLELGGIPIATALSLETGLPVAFVRKEAKRYGTARLVEGAELEDRRVLVVEDVVTSGGQVALSTGDIRNLGGLVTTALCVVDREEGGRAALEREGIELRSLFRRSDLDRSQQS